MSKVAHRKSRGKSRRVRDWLLEFNQHSSSGIGRKATRAATWEAGILLPTPARLLVSPRARCPSSASSTRSCSPSPLLHSLFSRTMMVRNILSPNTSRFGQDVCLNSYISCQTVTHRCINISFENRGLPRRWCTLLRLVLLPREAQQ